MSIRIEEASPEDTQFCAKGDDCVKGSVPQKLMECYYKTCSSQYYDSICKSCRNKAVVEKRRETRTTIESQNKDRHQKYERAPKESMRWNLVTGRDDGVVDHYKFEDVLKLAKDLRRSGVSGDVGALMVFLENLRNSTWSKDMAILKTWTDYLKSVRAPYIVIVKYGQMFLYKERMAG